MTAHRRGAKNTEIAGATVPFLALSAFAVRFLDFVSVVLD
jgi:hypothetical protein